MPVNRFTVLMLLVFLACALDNSGLAQDPETLGLKRRVTDLTGTIETGDLSRLEARLLEFERSTSTQIVVVMIPTLGGEDLEETSLRLAEENGVGRRNRDNGILLLIVKNDRKVRIEVGYGLEGVLPDALAGTIIRKAMAPRFRGGDYAGGISAALEAIMLATRGEYTAGDADDGKDRNGGIPFFLILFLLILFMTAMRRRRIAGFPIPIGFPPIGGGRGRGMFGGGGFGGGFSGGGGGFGGGGASGSW